MLMPDKKSKSLGWNKAVNRGQPVSGFLQFFIPLKLNHRLLALGPLMFTGVARRMKIAY